MRKLCLSLAVLCLNLKTMNTNIKRDMISDAINKSFNILILCKHLNSVNKELKDSKKQEEETTRYNTRRNS